MAEAGVVLGVDIGTTSAKAVAYDAAGTAHGTGESGYPLDEPEPGHAIQDPALVLHGAVTAAREAAARAKAAGTRVVAIAFGGALHSLIGLDARGRPVTPSITWADARAATEADDLRASPAAAGLHRRTGTPLHAMSPLAKLAWLRRRDPALHSRATQWVQIKDHVLAGLTGELVTDHSTASATGLFDGAALDWDAEALDIAGVTPARLPRVGHAAERLTLLPHRARDLGVDPATPVLPGAGDGPLATLGLGAIRPGVAACSIGTSGALRLMADAPARDPGGRVFSYLLTPGRWVTGGAINNGGSVLRWAAEALAPDLGPEPEAALLDLAARAPAGCDGLLMLPYLLGERAPRWSSAPRGAYVGLTSAHRREHLVRAALEGVCLQLALVLEAVRATGAAVHEVRAAGGFARSPLWRGMLASALGTDVGFAAGHQAACLGAALIGLEAMGMIESVDAAARLVPITTVAEPDARDRETYADRLRVFAAAGQALDPTFAALLRQRAQRRPADR